MMARKISGADDPRAIKVKFAIVGFQMLTFLVLTLPSSSLYDKVLLVEVIYSIDSMNKSATIEIPKNR